MAAGAPADGFVNQLPALSTKTPTTEPPLAAAADHGEYNTQPNPGSAPAIPVSPSAAGAAQAARATKPGKEKSKKSKKNEKNAKKKQRGKNRPPGGQETEDLENHPVAWLADFAADQQALYEDSDDYTDADAVEDMTSAGAAL